MQWRAASGTPSLTRQAPTIASCVRGLRLPAWGCFRGVDKSGWTPGSVAWFSARHERSAIQRLTTTSVASS